MLQEFVFRTCLLHLNDYCTIFAAIGVCLLSLIAFGYLQKNKIFKKQKDMNAKA